MVKGAEFSSFSGFTVPGIVSSVFFSRLCLFVCLFVSTEIRCLHESLRSD